MKYRIIILIIIIFSLGQILLSYIANMHMHMLARTPAHTAVAVQVVAVRWVAGPQPSHS